MTQAPDAGGYFTGDYEGSTSSGSTFGPFFVQGAPKRCALHRQAFVREYVRGDYATIDEFMDGWDWQFDYDAKKRQLTFNPIRDEYAVVQPVTNKAGVLMLNYYTTGPPPKRFASQIPIEMLRIDDRFFFTTY
jgi:hypothetical protein